MNWRRFQVSHAPIREAMMQLAQEGLIFSQTNYGVRIASEPDARTVRLFLPIREQLELYALSHAATAETTGKRRDMEREQAAFATAIARGDDAAARVADYQFHAELVRSADDPRVGSAWRVAVAATNAFQRGPASNAASLWSRVEQHQRILNAIRSQCWEESREALLANLRDEVPVD